MTNQLWLFLALSSCVARPTANGPSPNHSDTPEQKESLPPQQASLGVEDPRLRDLLEAHWEHQMASSPLWATQLGDHRFDHLLGDWGPAGHAASRTQRANFLQAAKTIQPESPRDQLTLELLVHKLSSQKALEVCESEIWSFSPRDNPLFLFNSLHEMHPIETLRDAENFLRRLDAIPEAIQQTLDSLAIGASKDLFANAESAQRVIDMAEATLALPSNEWPIAKAKAPEGFELSGPIVQRIDTTLRKTLSDYRDALRDQILPHARGAGEEGLFALPNGQACYSALIRHHTTLDKTAEELHQVGLQSLEDIHREMQTLGETLFNTQDLNEIFNHLRTNPDLRFDSSEEVVQKAEDALALAKEKMHLAFDPVPRADCEVQPIPEYEAPYTTIAYYRPSAADGSRPGTYYVNAYAPETRPRFEAEVLAYHEAIPGHHLQIAIAQELPELPTFRRVMHMTAFVEGWALYSERLSDEMGLYSGPADQMGMLSFDSWRAARLVVDTGLHSKGWTRQQAIDFMLANTPLAQNNIENEVDRYITTPGQALAYKTGQLEILRLRDHAETQLGESFDLKAFHKTLLGGGSVTLGVLAERIEDWIRTQMPE